MAKRKKAPVRTVKKNAVVQEKTPVPVSQEIPETQESLPVEIPETPEQESKADNVVPLRKDPKAYIEDPAAVFKLCMLESDLQKVQLQMQLAANQAAEQIQQLINKRDKSLASLNGQFQKLRERHIKFREYIEQKHGICIKHYVYDDEVGVFKLNQKVKEQDKENSNG